MENHITTIEAMGNIHIGDSVNIDNRQPVDGSKTLPVFKMDNMKPGLYLHLRLHLGDDLTYTDCFVHEHHLGELMDSDDGDVRFLDTLDLPDDPAQSIITWHDEKLKDHKEDGTSLATHVGLAHNEAAGVFVGRGDDGRITAIAIDPYDVLLYDRYKGDLKEPFLDYGYLTMVSVGATAQEMDWAKDSSSDNTIHYIADGTIEDDIYESSTERDLAKGFVPSTNMILGRLMQDKAGDYNYAVFATRYDLGRQGIRDMFAAMHQEYENRFAPTTVDISDLDVASDKQL